MSYARTGDASQANAYNGLDDRVSVTSGSTTHSFVYDPSGRLIGEYDSSGAPVAETIWLSPEVANDNQPFGGDDGVGGYAPLALVTGSGTGAAIYWVHANHIGVPLVTTDTSGAVATPTGYTMLGFPGQTRTLADLYYNRYRDYDSSLGRYIQADPIGLGGGDNPFLYAEANPLKYTDPDGLFVPPAPAALLLAPEAGGAVVATAAFCATPVGWFVCGGAAVVAVGTAGYFAYKHFTKDCPDGKCPPCTPYGAGTIGYIGPHTDHDHYPVGRPHLNLFVVRQNPQTCKCYWNKANPSAVAPPARRGWVDLNRGFPALRP